MRQPTKPWLVYCWNWGYDECSGAWWFDSKADAEAFEITLEELGVGDVSLRGPDFWVVGTWNRSSTVEAWYEVFDIADKQAALMEAGDGE